MLFFVFLFSSFCSFGRKDRILTNLLGDIVRNLFNGIEQIIQVTLHAIGLIEANLRNVRFIPREQEFPVPFNLLHGRVQLQRLSSITVD